MDGNDATAQGIVTGGHHSQARARSRVRWLPRPRTAGVLLILLCLLLLVLLPELIWGHSARTPAPSALNQAPSADHWLGTDALGRDVLERTLVAGRLSISLSVLALGIGVVSGLVLGGLAAAAGRRIATVISGTIAVLVAFPSLMMALFLAVIFGSGAEGSTLAIGFALTPYFARVTENASRTALVSDYVAAARCLGVRGPVLYARHVLPSVSGPVLTSASVFSGTTLLAFASLSFLGLGVTDPSIDWGSMLDNGLGQLYTNPALALGPSLAIVIVAIAFNTIGETLTSDRRRRRTVHGRTAPPERVNDNRKDVGAGLGPYLLRVEGLAVEADGLRGGNAPVVDFGLSLRAGERVGLVGESGSGKSLSIVSLIKLDAPGTTAHADVHYFDGDDLNKIRAGRVLRKRLAGRIGLVGQDPMSALNPVVGIGSQMVEETVVHGHRSRRDAKRLAVRVLEAVGIQGAGDRLRSRPHQFSGGMRQRVAIGMALMDDPALIVADEPTTALDATVQLQVLELLRKSTEDTNAALLLVSHDLGVIANLCTRVLVMYGGRIVEELEAGDLRRAQHPYTRALVESVPDLEAARERRLNTIPGRPPEPANRPGGCVFAPRCPRAQADCVERVPQLEQSGPSRVACFHPIPDGRSPGTTLSGPRRDGGSHEGSSAHA
ncbi:dipeptide/oligopeptide/nickel ABC transporter permease/ATP-binding protein [Amycolatopsis sp. K13G38]|uniref:Dipeptide/oligopeptide/nickel ABC transporter permease/ATP-binding protein n=1 Tax=Amycolatopsis acididurans TaxID=2724524 RepID=A0ABX1JHE7_9PSEU|nr:dipeptide/oligopeptide/nickel ABC transporter permease/ATP-binding protein [Amycolatopsis acididurans]NKQ58205.1 dipeptide/oligopeptide/nickel ABC transporter permease/ATP-binding protein [Amycolatopsis acididurans]